MNKYLIRPFDPDLHNVFFIFPLLFFINHRISSWKNAEFSQYNI